MSDQASAGIVGCGSIGTEVAKAVAHGETGATLSGLWDADSEAAGKLAGSLDPRPGVMEPRELAAVSTLVAECASVSAVAPLVDICIESGTDLMVMSVGGLTLEHFERFRESGSTLYIPSGAIAGLDALQAYAGNIETLTLTTRKPPAGLKGAKYLEDKDIDLDSLDGPRVIFEGPPSEAIKHFPKNVNVSTALALASSMGDNIAVKLVADPAASSNIHEISLVSPLGSIGITVQNRPSPSNPKTSALAYMSAIATLKKIFSSVKMGT